ncbi:MAG: helix-turn-helix domain-containing protein [Rhodoferax sp.]
MKPTRPSSPPLYIGPRLRALRRRRGLTIAELGQAVHIDKAHVSRIERGLKTPSIGTLARIAKTLDAPIGYLIGETLDLSEVTVTRGEQLGVLLEPDESAQHSFAPLLHGGAVRDFEAFLVYPKHEGGALEAHHDGQEMIYMLTGTIDVIFSDHVERLRAGDCIHFPGYLSHRIARIGRARASALLVLSAG